MCSAPISLEEKCDTNAINKFAFAARDVLLNGFGSLVVPCMVSFQAVPGYISVHFASKKENVTQAAK